MDKLDPFASGGTCLMRLASHHTILQFREEDTATGGRACYIFPSITAFPTEVTPFYHMNLQSPLKKSLQPVTVIKHCKEIET